MDQRTPGIRPRPTPWRRLDAASRAAFPAACAALLMLLLAGPLGLPGQAQLGGGAALASVFFWSVYRPASMPPQAVFLLGLLADLLWPGPVGVSVLVLLVAHGLAIRWRRVLVRQGFPLMWLIFAGVAAGAAAFDWALASLLTLRLLPPEPALVRFVLASGSYPVLAALFTRAHRGLADPAQA